jgi:protein phosphatase
MRGKMDVYGLSDRGRVRQANEDQFLIADLNKSLLVHQTSLSHDDHTRLFGGSQGKLLLVADGMGGHAQGQRASAVAVGGVTDYVLNTMPWFFRLEPDQEADLDHELRAALEECQRRIEAVAAGDPQSRGMGTTLTLAYVLWPRLYVVHAGDSRCYLLRGGRLEQITKDHTVAQQLVDQGALRPEEAHESRWSHVLWNCVGGTAHALHPDVYKASLQVGDTLLLCTDGLTASLPPAQVREVLGRGPGAERTCRDLVEAANTRGGPDNVTVVVAQFRDERQPATAGQHQAAMAAESGEGALAGVQGSASSRPPVQQLRGESWPVVPEHPGGLLTRLPRRENGTDSGQFSPRRAP